MDEAVALGSRTVNVNRRGLLFWPTQSKVVRFVPEQEIAFRVEENWTVWSYTLEPTDDGRTRVTARREGRLDLAVGGFTDQNPWVQKAALTRPYAEVTVAGTTEAHVMMVPMGENALQSALERWLDEHGKQ